MSNSPDAIAVPQVVTARGSTFDRERWLTAPPSR